MITWFALVHKFLLLISVVIVTATWLLSLRYTLFYFISFATKETGLHVEIILSGKKRIFYALKKLSQSSYVK